MKRTLIFIVCLGMFLGVVADLKSQNTLEGVYNKERVRSRRPIPYQYVRESDIMWSKTIWRKIDVKEKINLPFYYPEKPTQGRMSLINLLLWGIETQGISAYAYGDDYEFKRPITRDEINERFDAQDQTKMIEDVETGELIETVIKGEAKTAEVKEYLVKELWFFDRQRSIMEVRVLGICPVRVYFKEEDIEELEPVKRPLFWVYFPQVRKILANHEVFNPINDAERMSYDDLFFKRFFSSYIVKESNAYDDRWIDDYAVGLEAMLENERIKQTIFDYEHDLWEF